MRLYGTRRPSGIHARPGSTVRGQDVRVGLSPDLIVKTGKILLKLIGRDEADKATRRSFRSHVRPMRNRVQRVAPTPGRRSSGVGRISCRDVETLQGGERLREFAIRFRLLGFSRRA